MVELDRAITKKCFAVGVMWNVGKVGLAVIFFFGVARWVPQPARVALPREMLAQFNATSAWLAAVGHPNALRARMQQGRPCAVPTRQVGWHWPQP